MTVDQAWSRRAQGDRPVAKAAKPPPATQPAWGSATKVGAAPAGLEADGGSRPIAYVNGRPIGRDRVVNLLLAGHGVGILEQLVALEEARHLANERGIMVTDRDILAEHDRSLRNLLSPLEAADETAGFDRAEAERVLDELLSQRNISRAEYRDVITRNAYLRAIVEADMHFTDEQLREEYDNAYGERVQVRHIQLASLTDAEKVAGLIANGGDFAILARQYSANLRTAPGGGLLPPFSRNDESIPEGLRAVAFDLKEGQVSDPVRVDAWYHIVKLQRRFHREDVSFEAARRDLEKRLRERMVPAAMQVLFRKLVQDADVRIVDPVLEAEYQRKHPETAPEKDEQ